MACHQTLASKSGASVEKTIESINSELCLQIPLHPVTDSSPLHGTPASKCQRLIQFLCYQGQHLLDQCIDEYRNAITTAKENADLELFCLQLQTAQHKAKRDMSVRRNVLVHTLDAFSGPSSVTVHANATSNTLLDNDQNVTRTHFLETSPDSETQFSFGNAAPHFNFSFTSQTPDTTPDDTPFSSQEEQADTANTSFAFNFEDKQEVSSAFLQDIKARLQPGGFQIGTSAQIKNAVSVDDDQYDGDTEPDDDQPLLTGPNPVQKHTSTEVEKLCEQNESMEHYHLRKLPQQGLFVDDASSELNACSHKVRFECTRIALHCGVPPQLVSEQVVPQTEDYDELWEAARKVMPSGASLPRLSNPGWKAAGTKNMRLTGVLSFNSDKADRLLSLRLNPCEPEMESNRFFRKFGAHRFLRLDIPTGESLPQHLKGSRELYRKRLSEWLSVPNKTLLGCSWNVLYFHLNTKKKGRYSKENPQDSSKSQDRAFLFATRGTQLDPISLHQVWNWFMPFDLNRQMTFLKAYSRLQLGFSGTRATIKFRPSQVRFVPDMKADSKEDPGTFNDLSFDWTQEPDPNAVMNDGCARISFGAAKRVWECLGKSAEKLPSVFQARIGPAKGVWMVEPPSTQVETHLDIWIELGESQVKFICAAEDRDDALYDPNRLTFEVVNWSSKATSHHLHLDPLHIMHDRGVPKSCFESILVDVFESESDDLLKSLSSSADLRIWLQSRLGAKPSSKGMTRWQGDFPESLQDQVCKLLESGFAIQEFQYLATQTQKLFEFYLGRLSKSLKLPMSLSTYVIGVADPYRCLAPDEIHLHFSKSFVDPKTSISYPFLDDIAAIVTRHPTLRNSDIQKVKCVFKRELKHLQDVVVFPTTGKFPLAGKLQGGDYDGDTFWICWEPALVETFYNAPAPLISPDPEEFGIKVDRRNLESFRRDLDQTQSILNAAFSFHLQPNFLGICTNYLEMLKYATDPIPNQVIDKVTSLHDLLVDSAKNGYQFGFSSWTHFVFSLGLGKTKLAKPLHKRVEEITQNDLDLGHERANPANIGDYLVFKVAFATKKRLSTQLNVKLNTPQTFDKNISSIYTGLLTDDDELLEAAGDYDPSLIHQGLRKLRARLKRLYTYCNHLGNNGHVQDKDSSWKEARIKSHEDYLTIGPDDFPVAMQREWLRRSAKYAPCFWECLKAATLFHEYHSKPQFCFSVAGDCICYLKALSTQGATALVAPVLQRMKMGKSKVSQSDRPAEDEPHEDALLRHETTTLESAAQSNDSIEDLTQQFSSSGIVA